MLDHYLAADNFAELESILQRRGLLTPIVTPAQLESMDVGFLEEAELIEAVLRRRVVIGGLPEQTSFALILSPVYVAFVTLMNSGYCITISTGLVRSIECVCAALSATPSFCRLFGIDSPDLASAAIAPSDDWMIEFRIPATQRQAALAIACGESALAFTINHETAHILNGHLSMLSQGQAGFVLAEIDDDAKCQPEDILLRQCLEWDADHSSVGATLGDNLQLSGSASDWERLLITFVAVKAIWRLFDFRLAGPRWGRIHPPPSYRALSAFVIERYLDIWSAKVDGYEKERLRLLGNQLQKEMADVFPLVLKSLMEAGAPTPIEEIRETSGEPGKQLTRALHMKWAAIYPALVKLKIGTHNLAKPMVED